MQAPVSAPPAGRLASVDILRGLVMVVMVLDHVRDFFHVDALALDPLDPTQTTPLLFGTRWITHFCAPVFVLLAGTSGWLQLARGKSRGELSRFLLTRGLWLVLMELTLIGFGWSFTVDFLFLQVIWAIGVSMVVLAALVWLPWPAVAAIGGVIVVGHNLFDPVRAQDLGAFGPVWALLHQPAPIIVGGKMIGFIAYPLAPWIGVMALGYGLGPALTQPARRRHLLLYGIGGGLVLLFLALRATGGYGDPDGWTTQATPVRTAMDFLSTTKYPASLQFLCMTLGPAIMLLPVLEKLKGRWTEPWATFGAAPFFFYIAHIYVVHLASTGLARLRGYPGGGIADLFRDPNVSMGFGLPLWQVYLVWIVVVAALYLPTRAFARLKARHPGTLLSYF